MIKTVTTIEGVNAINFGNTADRYYWCKNIGETTLYVSAKEDISPDADDVAILKSGDIVMIETYNQDIYVLGAGKIQIYESETNDCPFKVGGKGGEIPDLSVYAKTADVPNIKVNAAVNADTVNGHSVNADVPEDAVFTDTVVDINVMEYSVNFSEVSWATSTLGKFESYITLNNVNKIISINLGNWDNFNPDDIVQALIVGTNIFGFMSNTAKSNGHMTFRITYI